jgi:hypothetical protein
MDVKGPTGVSEKPAGKIEMPHAVLGFRAHSGWAAMVAVAGPTRSPIVIGRRRIELAAPEIPRPVQPYHAAQVLDLKQAEVHVQHFADEAKLLAKQALRTAIKDLRDKGYEVVASGIVLGSGRPAPSLEAALASHPMLHTAEGELFRNAIALASAQCHMSVLGLKERDLYQRGMDEFGLSLDALKFCLAKLGQPLGPPWGQDQKLATLVAWLALGPSSRRHP